MFMKKRRNNFLKLILSLIVLVLLVGGSYALWLNVSYKNYLKDYTIGEEVTFEEYYNLVLKERKRQSKNIKAN